MLKDSLALVPAIKPWNKRIDTLSLMLKAHLVDVCTARTEVARPALCHAMEIATQGVSELLADTSTIGLGTLRRSSFGEVIDTILTLVFMSYARENDQPLTDIQVAISRHDGEGSKTLERLLSLMQVGSQWMLRVAVGRNLAAQYAALPPSEQSEWRRCRDALGSIAISSHYDAFFAKRLQDRTGELWACLDRLRFYGTLAQLDKTRPEELHLQRPNTQPADTAIVFHALVTRPATAPIFGFLVATKEHLLVWTSQEWSEWAQRYSRSGPNEREALLHESPQCSLAKMIASLGVRTVAATDLTRGNIPLELAIDPHSRSLICTTPVATDCGARASCRRVQFWGGFEFGRRPSFTVVEETREIDVPTVKGKKVRLTFPTIPAVTVRLPGVPSPLPFAHYERWELAAIAASTDLNLQQHWGRASKTDFFAQDWSVCDILHLATHGEAFSEVPECSHFVLGNAHGLPDCLTFTDILSIDWSHLSLVFLNCCVTEVGKQSYGDDRLSLAWSFIAGGAKAVIAHRWRVSDEAAFLFAKGFYSSMFREGCSIREAFFGARQQLQQSQNCSDVTAWGTFVLLENPWITSV